MHSTPTKVTKKLVAYVMLRIAVRYIKEDNLYWIIGMTERMAFKSTLSVLAAGALLLGGANVAGAAPTNHQNSGEEASSATNGESAEKDTIERLVELNPGTSAEEMRSAARNYAESNGISAKEAAKDALDEAEASVEDANSPELMSSPGESGSRTLGYGRNKGDVFYAPATTWGFNHGHNGIYYTTATIVEAPGGDDLSRANSAWNYSTDPGTKKQKVATTQSNRNSAADRAYNSYRHKDYRSNFAFNKYTDSANMNCSQLVWAAYKSTSGIDIDSNGGPGVYPGNIRDDVFTVTYQTL
ncbi:uncharacterized protein YycO [Actinopolyspora biskrensis]|uniref:Uncharacterized protein YycO n=1 Tax=Actinopolyspora biskrensis TaxID=1470178 RepID=A0A852ZB20_9ACTN|nr:hypothetical protein [Actinopolyspora biskrensis]NYH79263.1 uncharacterized protein YycO [Actinopolyspora biskrensis]